MDCRCSRRYPCRDGRIHALGHERTNAAFERLAGRPLPEGERPPVKHPSFDPYAVLGLSPDATPEQIKAAFRRRAKAHHPDHSREPDAEARFRRAREAFELLVDPANRRAYDEHLAQARQVRTQAEERARRTAVDRARAAAKEASASAARARQQEVERQHATAEAAERARRAAAQREQARRAKEEHDAVMRRVFGRPRSTEPSGDDAADLRPPPTWIVQPNATQAYEIRETSREAAARGRHTVAIESVREPSDVQSSREGDPSPGEFWAFCGALVFAVVTSGSCTLWFLVQGMWIGALLCLTVQPVAMFVVGLGIAYPLTAGTVAIVGLVRWATALGRSSVGWRDKEPARVRRLLTRYAMGMAACVTAGSVDAWLGCVVADGQPAHRKASLELICGLTGLALGSAALALTFSLMFALVSGRATLRSGPSSGGQPQPAGPAARPQDRPSTSSQRSARTPRGSRSVAAVPAS